MVVLGRPPLDRPGEEEEKIKERRERERKRNERGLDGGVGETTLGSPWRRRGKDKRKKRKRKKEE